jgi:hypothetical protein
MSGMGFIGDSQIYIHRPCGYSSVKKKVDLQRRVIRASKGVFLSYVSESWKELDTWMPVFNQCVWKLAH